MAAPRALRGAVISRGSVDLAATISSSPRCQRCAHRLCNHRHVVPGNLEQTEAEPKAPVAFGRRELEPADEGLDRRFSGRAPADVTAERRETAADVRLIG